MGLARSLFQLKKTVSSPGQVQAGQRKELETEVRGQNGGGEFWVGRDELGGRSILGGQE